MCAWELGLGLGSGLCRRDLDGDSGCVGVGERYEPRDCLASVQVSKERRRLSGRAAIHVEIQVELGPRSLDLV